MGGTAPVDLSWHGEGSATEGQLMCGACRARLGLPCGRAVPQKWTSFSAREVTMVTAFERESSQNQAVNRWKLALETPSAYWEKKKEKIKLWEDLQDPSARD